MQPKLLKISALFLLFTVGLVYSCQKECPCSNTKGCNCPVPQESKYHIEVSFNEYSLDGSYCEWANLKYDDTAIIINSSEELEQYVTCSDGYLHAINFSHFSLICASGKIYGTPVDVVKKQFLQISDNKYALNINLISGTVSAMGFWIVSIIVPKLSQNDIVTLYTNVE
jgi:hypothetical protein